MAQIAWEHRNLTTTDAALAEYVRAHHTTTSAVIHDAVESTSPAPEPPRHWLTLGAG